MKTTQEINKNRNYLIGIIEVFGIGLFFLGTHLPFLLALPVFADEAIYIRWAQLIDDSSRYLFFSMADGKPPLFIWLLNLCLKIFYDPLFAGRMLATVVGLITVFVIGNIITLLGGNRWAKYIGMLSVTFMPFWYFYHRMALMDGLLTLGIAGAVLFSLRISKLVNEKNKKLTKRSIFINVSLLSLSFASALMSKTPALFAIPIIALIPFIHWKPKQSFQTLWHSLIFVGIGGFIACLLFSLLRISPLFGSLFSRSSDFTFTTKELLQGQWRYVLFSSLPRDVGWIVTYLTPEFIGAGIIGFVVGKNRRQVAWMVFFALLFATPLVAVGRVLTPRYFLPSAVFLTVAGAIVLGEWIEKSKVWCILAFSILVLMGIQAFQFIQPSWFRVGNIPFVEADRIQYLQEWSAGFGNTQVRDYVIARQRLIPQDSNKKVIVATEGSFGTLPDGLLMYFHHPGSAMHLEIFGIGEPIRQIPATLITRAKTNEVYIMVNSHRLYVHDNKLLSLVFEVKRPGNAPSLLFFRITP